MNFDRLIENFKLNKQEFYFQFNSHPNYPSALAFSDTLSFLGLKNDAYQLDKEFWDELPEEYMAVVENSFSLVKKKGNDFIIYSDKIKTLNKEELHQKSGDFIFLFEKTENIKTKSFFNFTPVLYLVFGIIALYSLLQLAWYESVFNILSLIGVYISLELFNQKFGQESAAVNNICGGAAKSASQSSCLKIFSSDKTNILGLKLSDFSLIYFLGITFVGLLFPQAQFILRMTTLTSILVILYSLYIQAFVEKSLCKVCLVIIFVLLSQIAISSFYFSWETNLAVAFTSVILFISLFFAIAFLNNLMNQKEELKKSNAKNLRFKRNYDIFKQELLNNEKIVFQDNTTFSIGNKNAKLRIAIVSNPYCGFCKDAHKIIDNILDKYTDKVFVQIRFNYSNEQTADEKYTNLISNFLNIYKYKSENEFLKAIDLWFKDRNENILKKYITTEKPENLSNIIQMTNENKVAGINFTPVFIVNGYRFPDKYDRDDINYFIKELLEDDDFN